MFSSLSVFSLHLVSNSFGKELKKDELGQFNILLAGYGGEGHDGDFLTDTIMLASYSPDTDSVTFLSIPRDLYVEYNEHRGGKINGLFSYYYHSNGGDTNVAANKLLSKVREITGVDVGYYALVDFTGFKNMINTLGGIDVEVPRTLVDNKYPTKDGGYTTFKIEKGFHTLDGEKALKYARSRHSTSDFSRTLRQQQIIKGIIKKFFSFENVTSVDRLKSLYGKYKDMVKTNISFKQILGMSKYIDDFKNFFSFVYNVNCRGNEFQMAEPGCFLYYPPREGFGGMSVILPKGANKGDLDYYKKLQNFAFMVVHNQEYLVEDADIVVKNGIHSQDLREKHGYLYPVASDLATKLKKYGFDIKDVGNTDTKYEDTVVYRNGTGDYSGTVDMLRMFLEVDSVLSGSTDYDSEVTVVLGDSYLK